MDITTDNTKPELKTNEQGSYKGLFLAPINHLERIKTELTKMAETDVELANAIAEGKKTFEGCDRYIRNNMSDLAKELGKREITFDDATVHLIARYYMVNPDNLDAQNTANVVKAVSQSKPMVTTTPKASASNKIEPKKGKANADQFMDDLFDL